MANGTVDIRTRDNKRHGTKKVNVIADEMDALKCEKSAMFTKFYENVWKAEDYATASEEISAPEESK